MTTAPSYPIKMLAASAVIGCLLASATLGMAGSRGGGFRGNFGGYVGYGYAQPYYGGSGYGSPVYYGSSAPTAGPYLPNGWWTGSYGTADPRGESYNPAAGYAWDSITTLILETFPTKARVTLDGIFVGTCDLLGPFQLPAGQHTLRVDAAGYEPSETVLKIEKPVVQQLEVRLSASARTGKPAPKP